MVGGQIIKLGGNKLSLKCPHCGKSINLIAEGQKRRNVGGAVFASSQKLLSAAAAATHPPAGVPSHLPNRESHIFVPLTQAVITGLFIGSIGGVTMFAIGLAGDLSFDYALSYSCYTGVVCFLVVAAWQWSRRLNAYDSLLWKAEQATGWDINQDGEIGRPEPQMVRVELKEENAARWQFADLAIEPTKLKELARAFLVGKSFSERVAVDCGLTQEQFRELRDKFIDRQWAQWNHPTRRQQGVSLTHRGRAVLQTIAHSAGPVVGNGDLAERYVEIE